MNTLIICDIQRPYLSHRDETDVNYIRKVKHHLEKVKYDDYIIFYNGIQTCTSETKSSVEYFLTSGCKFPLDIVSNAKFYDKGCGYLANSIVEYNLPVEEVVYYSKVLYKNKKIATDLIENNHFTRKYCPEVLKLKKFTLHPIIQTLDRYKNSNSPKFTLIGGSTDFCLMELELTLQTLDASFTTLKELTYTS